MLNDNHDNTSMARRLLKAGNPARPPDFPSNTSSRPSQQRRRGKAGIKNALLSPRAWLLSLLALAMVWALWPPFATPPAASAAGITFWSATLTVGSELIACTNTDNQYPCNSTRVLTDDDFTYDGVGYAFIEMTLVSGTFAFRLDKEIPADIRSGGQFHVDGMTFDFQDASISSGNTKASWKNSGLSWSAGDRVQLRLSDPNRAGGLDRTFGIGGKLTTAFNPAASEIHDIVEQPDGKIVAVGYAHNGTNKDFAIARYNPDGSLDGSFGTGGRVLTDFGSTDEARAVALQSDGKIVVAGLASVSNLYDFAVARYTPNGTLDRNFGKILNDHDRSGKKITSIGATDIAHAVAIDSNNRIVVGGQAGDSFGVARYNTIGDLDTTFSEDGKATVNFGDGADHALAMAILANDRILLGGYSTNTNGTPGTNDDHKDIALAALLSTGVPPADFDTDGKLTTSIRTASDDQINDIAIQSNGKIVVAGYSDDKWIVARYNTGGALDGEFGKPKSGGSGRQGYQSSTGPNIRSIELTAVAIRPDEKIVVSGYGISSLGGHVGESAMVMLGLEANGENDATSGAPLNFDRFDDRSHGMALLDDGRVMLGGYINRGSVKEFHLARYNANGSLDGDFGMAGEVTTSFGSDDEARAVALQSDGKIVAAGLASASGIYDFAVARYTPNGTLDRNFGAILNQHDRSGKKTTDMGATDIAHAVAIDSNNNIVVGGQAANKFGVARYNKIGDPDTNFNTDGKVTVNFGDGADHALAMAILANDRILLGGYSTNTNGTSGTNDDDKDIALAQLLSTGILPADFDTDGKVTTDFNSLDDSAQAIAMVSGGGLVAAGYATNDAGTPLDTTSTQTINTSLADDHKDFAVAYYSSDGELNEDFDTDGKVTLDFNGGHDEAKAVAVDGNGKFVVAGYASNSSNTNKDFAVVRYNANGTPDTGFGTDGKVITAIGSGDDVVTAMAIDGNGKIVVAGYSDNGADHDFALVRYNADGTLDTGFGVGGKVTTDFAATDDRAHAMVLDDDGFILLAGQSGDEFALARYLPQRSLSTDTRLSGLAVQTSTDGSAFSAGTLSPDFAVGTAGYTMAQLTGVTHVKVTPTTRDPNASVTVQGQATASGAASAAVPVTAGATTTVSVTVTAEDGRTTRTYTISVQVLANDATLSALSVTTSTDGSAFSGAATLTPAFASGTTSYETNLLPKEVTHVKVTPTVSDSGATVTVQGTATTSGTASAAIAVAQGTTTTVTMVVTSQDGLVTQTYAVGVRVRSPGAHIAVAPNPVAEGADAQITVTIPEAQSQDVTIPITTTAVSAQSADYSAPSSIRIAAGATTGTGTLQTRHDPDAEDETLTVALGSNLPAQITAGSPNSITVTIDDDEFVSTVRVQGTTPDPVAEGETVSVTLGISPAQPNRLVIPVTLTHGTSESGDFSSLTSITIEANQTSGVGQIRTNHDSDAHDETFTVALGGNLPQLTTAGTPNSATITIDDDEVVSFVTINAVLPDQPVEGETIYIRLAIAPTQPSRMVIPLTFTHGTSEAGDFTTLSSITIDANQLQAVGQIRANQDSDQDDETFTVALGSNLPGLVTAGTPDSMNVSIEDDDDVVAPKQAPWLFMARRGNASLTPYWNYREDHSDYAGIDVQYREKGTSWADTNIVSASPELDDGRWGTPMASHTITGLTNGTTYEVRVRARNSEGAGPWSLRTREGTPVAPPGAPTGVVVATAQYCCSLTVSWTAPSNDVTSYHLRYKESGSATWLKYAVPGRDEWADVPGTSVLVTNLTREATYDVQVRARIDDSTGAWSATAQGTTQ